MIIIIIFVTSITIITTTIIIILILIICTSSSSTVPSIMFSSPSAFLQLLTAYIKIYNYRNYFYLHQHNKNVSWIRINLRDGIDLQRLGLFIPGGCRAITPYYWITDRNTENDQAISPFREHLETILVASCSQILSVSNCSPC